MVQVGSLMGLREYVDIFIMLLGLFSSYNQSSSAGQVGQDMAHEPGISLHGNIMSFLDSLPDRRLELEFLLHMQ